MKGHRITFVLSPRELSTIEAMQAEGEGINQTVRRLALEAVGWMGAEDIRAMLADDGGWLTIAELVDMWDEDPRDRAARHRAARRALYKSLSDGLVERRPCDKPARSERGDGVPSRWEWRWTGNNGRMD